MAIVAEAAAVPSAPAVFVEVSFEVDDSYNVPDEMLVAGILRRSYRYPENGQLHRNRDGNEVTWTVRAPDGHGSLPETRYGFCRQLDSGPADLKPLTPRQWEALRLALDGVQDDTVSGEALATVGEEHTYLWDGMIIDHSTTLLSADAKAGKSTWLRAFLLFLETAWGDWLLCDLRALG
jgi:hypothetical protein